MSDLIDRQAAIRAVCEKECTELEPCKGECEAIWALRELPSAEPTLYGYKIEHLTFIAGMMAKENIPPEKVIEVLSDAGRVVEMVLAEQKEIMEREVKRWKIL